MNTTKRGVALLMALLLLFPISVDAFHFFNHDTHTHCTENGDTHFHQMPIECELCDLQITQILSIPETENSEVFHIPHTRVDNATYAFSLRSLDQTSYHLRGPPQK